MSSQLAGEQSSFVSGAFALAPPQAGQRSRPKERKSLWWGRFRRALARQTYPFLIVAISGVALGAFYAYVTREPWENSLLLFGAAGVGASFVLSMLREMSRNTIGALSSVPRRSGFAVIGAAPELTPDVLKSLAPDQRSPLGCLTYAPASPFAAAFRDLQDVIAANQVVAFIGAARNDGATTAALCAALSAAQQGRKVLLVDCDLRRRSLTRLLGRDPETGVLQAAENPETWADLLDHEEETGLPFIAAAKMRNPWRDLHSTKGFRDLLATLREHFDLIILDCPPAVSADGPMIARSADRSIVVAAWDETPMSALRHTMRALRARKKDATGLYVNRVPSHYRFNQRAHAERHSCELTASLPERAPRRWRWPVAETRARDCQRTRASWPSPASPAM